MQSLIHILLHKHMESLDKRKGGVQTTAAPRKIFPTVE